MSVGVFYWFGIVLLFCFAIFPYVSELNGFNEMNGELWVLTFLTPLNSFLAGDMDALMPTVVGVLYILNVAICLVCGIIATTRLFRVTKRNPSNKWGYNRAAKAMKVMSKCFALSFFAMLAFTAIAVSVLDGKPTLFFYLAFLVTVIIHFIGNIRGCKVSFFKITEDRFNPIEIKPTVRRKISFVRNAWQMVSIWLVILLTDRFGGSAPVFKILSGGEISFIDGLLLPALMLVVLGCLVVSIAHATGTVEYRALEQKKRGMKTCRNCALVIAVLALVAMVLAVISPAVSKTRIISLVGLFLVGVQWFFAERMFAIFWAKKEAEEEFPDGKSVEEVIKEELAEEVEPLEMETVNFEELSEQQVYYKPTDFVPDFFQTPNFDEKPEEPKKKFDWEGELTEIDFEADPEPLRNKWLTESVSEENDEETADTRLLTAQRVHCPCCNELLYVRFGWTKSKCSKCGTPFELKKL